MGDSEIRMPERVDAQGGKMHRRMTVVNDLDVTPNGGLVIAATHGRGLWSIPSTALG